MRANPRTRVCPAARTPTHIRIHTHVHTRTHMYARIRAREGNFLTSNLLYSITKPRSIISPTPFTSIIQSLYNPYQYWHPIGGGICTNYRQLSSSVAHLHPLSTITQLSAIHSIISRSSPIYYHCRSSSHAHHILSLSNVQSNSPSYQYVSML